MNKYDPKEIEPKWQQVWEDTKLYKAEVDSSKEKSYILDYFPYPSGAGLSVGHVRNYTISDVFPRFMRMRGYNVLHPMGWDAFGLPAENYAIQNKVSPREATDTNKANYKKQMQRMGFSYDWGREVDSTNPNYYKWTQWFFLLLYEKELAYQKESEQWWCDTDKTVLANEQVEAGKCWRCGNTVTKKKLKQWFFKITDYADRLIDDLDKLDWPEGIKQQQRNWIGRSHGVKLKFQLKGHDEVLETFTTRVDTLAGATFIVLAPEHPMVDQLTADDHRKEIEDYLEKTKSESELERMDNDKEKTGVFTGSFAVNPLTDEEIPIWVADYVLMGYGSGAIMAVPSHDQRDYDFAQKFDLPIKQVVEGETEGSQVFVGEGTLMNSGEFDGLSGEKAKKTILDHLHIQAKAEASVHYRLRDWLISRQRYWGAPIPMIHCPEDGAVPVPKDQLPVELPEIDSYEPAGEGKSPLARVESFVNITCPKCGGPAKRETDTMDGFACSSWYFLRFADPHNDTEPFNLEKVKNWLPVDTYIGGAEHAVLHLLYARFWIKVMKDDGMIDFDEPFLSLRNQGMILASDGRKMSKSFGNVITPDEVIEQGYGADALRLFEMFIAPYNQEVAWQENGLAGTDRFIRRVWTIVGEFMEAKPGGEPNAALETALASLTHKTIKKVTDDISDFSFNTAVAALMEYVNGLYKMKVDLPFGQAPQTWMNAIDTLLKLLAPFAPFVTEELWSMFGHKESVHVQGWPKYDPNLVKEELIELPVQVNGKLRGTIIVPPDLSEKDIIELAKEQLGVAKQLEGKEIARTVAVPHKLINFVTK